MEPTLIAVTLLSLLMAAAMGSIAWRILRDERRRSAARVAVLAALADRESSPSDVGPAVPEPAALRHAERARPQEAPLDLPLRRDTPVSAARLPDGKPIAPGDLFATSTRPARYRSVRPLIVAGVGVVMALTLWAVWYAGTRAKVGGPALPLELVSLGHDRQDDTLRITGLVQNPRSGQEMRDVVAVVFLFARDGTFIASGRAPLDLVRLAAGDESPFVIIVPDAGDVARYRLGFRTRDGRVLTHVDRRFDASVVHRVGTPPGESALAAGAKAQAPERE